MCLDQSTMLPATPWGVWEIIKRTGNRKGNLTSCKCWNAAAERLVLTFIPHSTGIPTLGKNVVVAGRSKNVGMPIAMLLHTDGRHERPGGRLWHLCVCCCASCIRKLKVSKLNLRFRCRRRHRDHFSPLHSKGATSPTHSNRWYRCGCCRLVSLCFWPSLSCVCCV